MNIRVAAVGLLLCLQALPTIAATRVLAAPAAVDGGKCSSQPQNSNSAFVDCYGNGSAQPLGGLGGATGGTLTVNVYPIAAVPAGGAYTFQVFVGGVAGSTYLSSASISIPANNPWTIQVNYQGPDAFGADFAVSQSYVANSAPTSTPTTGPSPTSTPSPTGTPTGGGCTASGVITNFCMNGSYNSSVGAFVGPYVPSDWLDLDNPPGGTSVGGAPSHIGWNNTTDPNAIPGTLWARSLYGYQNESVPAGGPSQLCVALYEPTGGPAGVSVLFKPSGGSYTYISLSTVSPGGSITRNGYTFVLQSGCSGWLTGGTTVQIAVGNSGFAVPVTSFWNTSVAGTPSPVAPTVTGWTATPTVAATVNAPATATAGAQATQTAFAATATAAGSALPTIQAQATQTAAAAATATRISGGGVPDSPPATIAVPPAGTPVDTTTTVTCDNFLCSCIEYASGLIRTSVNGVADATNAVNGSVGAVATAVAGSSANLVGITSAINALPAPLATAASGAGGVLLAPLNGLSTSVLSATNALVPAVATPVAGLVVAVQTPLASVTGAITPVGTLAGTINSGITSGAASDYINGEFTVLSDDLIAPVATPMAQVVQYEQDIRNELESSTCVPLPVLGDVCPPGPLNVHMGVGESLAAISAEMAGLDAALAGLDLTLGIGNLEHLVNDLYDAYQSDQWTDQVNQFHGELQAIPTAIAGVSVTISNTVGGPLQTLPVSMSDVLSNTVNPITKAIYTMPISFTATISQGVATATQSLVSVIDSVPVSLTTAFSSTVQGLIIPQHLVSDISPLQDAINTKLPDVSAVTVPNASASCSSPTIFGVELDICGLSTPLAPFRALIGVCAILWFTWSTITIFEEVFRS